MSTAATELASRFGVQAVSADRMAGGLRNRAYRIVDAAGGVHVLTELVGATIDEARAVAATMTHVAEHGLASPALPTIEGDTAVAIPDGACVLSPFVEGTTLAEFEPLPIAAFAQALARLHAIAAPGHLASRRRRLPTDWHTRLPTDWTVLNAAIHASEAALLAIDPSPRPALLHGDAFPDNVILSRDGRIVAIDWEHAAMDDPLIDLGIAAVGLLARSKASIDDVRDLAGHYTAATGTTIGADRLTVYLNHGAALLCWERYALAPGTRASAMELLPLCSIQL